MIAYTRRVPTVMSTGRARRTAFLLTLCCLLFATGCSESEPYRTDQQEPDIPFDERIDLGAEAEAYGYLIDIAVSGVRYRSGEHYGLTDENGRFGYRHGESVEFFIGGILLGRVATPAPRVTPYSLAEEHAERALNIARFLQSLDNDANADNGIEIGSWVHIEAENATLDFAHAGWQSPDFPEYDMIDGSLVERRSAIDALVFALTTVSDAGARYLVTPSEAFSHLAHTGDVYIDALAVEIQAIAAESQCSQHSDCTIAELPSSSVSPCPVGPDHFAYAENATNRLVLEALLTDRNRNIQAKRALADAAFPNSASSGSCFSQSLVPLAQCNAQQRCSVIY